MVVGFSNKGPFNRPVLLEQDADRIAIFGDVDTKLEHKGCFFNRMLRTLLTGGPVIALNLLKVKNGFNEPDQINFAAMSLDAASANPIVTKKVEKFGEYDYLGESVDNLIYGTSKGDTIPYVGTTPFSSVYNRSRFWTPDKDLLTAAAARGLETDTYETGRGSFEYTNFLNFANVGTEEFSLLVFKPTNMNGYDVTAETWYGGKENIPFGWIRPYDYISDYFLQVVCVKGNWSNYPVLATDPIWGSYFDKKGIIKDKVSSFMSAEGISILGSWTGIIIPDFTDKQGINLSLEKKINAATERTGLLMSFNNDAANVLTYDYSGKDFSDEDPDQGCWGIDIDGNQEIEGGEREARYIIDMCGHGAFMPKDGEEATYTTFVPGIPIQKGAEIRGTRKKLAPNTIFILKEDGTGNTVEVSYSGSVDNVSTGTYLCSEFLFDKDSLIGTDFVDGNLANLINKDFYELSKVGLKKQEITYSVDESSNIKFKYDEINIGGPTIVEAYVKYNDADVKITFNVVTDIDGKITSVQNTEATIAIKEKKKDEKSAYSGINFLSYNYIADENDEVQVKVPHVAMFGDYRLWTEYQKKNSKDEVIETNYAPVGPDIKNMFIVTDAEAWADSMIKVGDFVHNITYNNEIGETHQYQLIPGLARVIKKQFVKVEQNTGLVNYKGHTYKYVGAADDSKEGNRGFYLITCSAPVFIEKDGSIMRQLPISDDMISHSLRFIPMKGLALSSRHRPGYDEDGNLNIEAGIEKIYSVLNDEGINRGLMNSAMVDYRYIIDSMSYGLNMELGGKVWLSRIAKDRGKCTAVLNLPSAKQFAVSSNPYFCDSYIPENEVRPALNTKYIAAGGNTEMGSEAVFSLPTEDDGAKFTACFWPNLIYTENGKTISMPPAADVANVLNRKFIGINDPYCICANQNGILSNKYLTGLEFLADRTDREYLEPFGVNTIIKDGNNIMIYGNQTAYQAMKSDLNKLHIRENLNTVEIECEAVLRRYNFLYNTAAVRANIVAQLTPILQVMQLSGALAKYEIICDESNNTPAVIEADTCLVDINLWFNHGMEKIVQTFTVNRYASLDE